MTAPDLAFGDLISPRDPEYLASAQQVYQERPDLQQAYASWEDVEFRKWVAACGVLEYPDRFARYFPPVPPLSLRSVVCGGREERTHLLSSMDDLQTVVRLLNVFADEPFAKIRSVLDFGCGCGRLLRWFPLAFPDVAVHGCDVHRQAIEWCQQSLAGTFVANDTQPPLDLADGSIDLIVSLSVFTHLERESSLAWMRELVRVCSPDGYLLLTTNGLFALHVATRSPDHQRLYHMTEQEARDALARLFRGDYVHTSTPAEWIGPLGVEKSYGHSFFTDGFIREQWSQHAEIIGYVPGGLSLLQDVYVLRPR